METVIGALEENPDDVFLETAQIIIEILHKIVTDPNDLKYRTLKLDDARFVKLLGTCGAMECLFHVGFIEDGDKLNFSTEQPLDYLKEFYNNLIERRRRMVIKKQQIDTEKHLKVKNPLLDQIKEQFVLALVYKDQTLLNEAKKVIPLVELKQKALASLDNLNYAEIHFSDCLLFELLKWFKQSFFKWVNAPECDTCKGSTRAQNQTIIDGLRAENYYCDACKSTTIFKRYNDPGVLLKTRRGRCGEWANCFTLLCCALGWDARLVSDKTDHAWTEVFSGTKNRWVHCDPCEMAIDTPLMYEVGWKKELTYVFAYSPYEVQDVTWRYSKNHKATLTRRTLCDETLLVFTLVTLRQYRQESLPESRKTYLEQRTVEELVQMMQENKRREGDEKERQSGSLLWRLQRGEASAAGNTLNVEYTWKPIKYKKWLCLRYDIVNDCYEQVDKDDIVLNTIKGWKNGVYKSKGIFRKEEFDWNNVYLARVEGTEEGGISWKFESTDDNIVIDTIDLRFRSTTYENGKVVLKLVSDEEKVSIVPKGFTYTSHEFRGKTHVCLIAKLQGGRGDVGWQHAQLFRQSIAEDLKDDYPFFIVIKFKSKV